MPAMSLSGLNAFSNGSDEEINNYDKSEGELNNIFDEIEELLKHNEGLGITTIEPLTTPIPPKQAKSQPSENNPEIISNENDGTLNFLPVCDNQQPFLITSDSHISPDEELSLYSVNQNELQPVNAPFMVPGIYKKITNGPTVLGNALEENSFATSTPTNVVFTTKHARGKIISRDQFENCSPLHEQCEENEQEYPSEEPKGDDAHYNKTTRALLKFACCVHKSAPKDQIEINRLKNELTRTQANLDRKIIYRLLGPGDVNMQVNDFSTLSTHNAPDGIPHLRLKKGRPKKQPIGDTDKNAVAVLPKKSKVVSNIKVPEPIEPDKNAQQPLTRTRYGRVVRTVRTQPKPATIEELTPTSESDDVKNLIEDSKDKDFRGGSQMLNSNTVEADKSSSLADLVEETNKRRVPPESICPKCGKIFLGRRLKRHFTQHPDHMLAGMVKDPNVPYLNQPQQQSSVEAATTEEEMSLFRFLITKLRRPHLNEEQRADLFLHELNDLIEQLQLRNTRLIRNTSGLHFVSPRTARVLGIPEGQYALDMSAFVCETPPTMETEQHSLLNGEEPKRPEIMPLNVSAPSLDYTAISMDGTLTDEAAQKLNLSAGGKLLPPSEESLLRGVRDLVHDNITKLVDVNLLRPPSAAVQSSVGPALVSSHYDHVSDNAVEALTIKENNQPQEGTQLLGVAVDFFQFKNN